MGIFNIIAKNVKNNITLENEQKIVKILDKLNFEPLLDVELVVNSSMLQEIANNLNISIDLLMYTDEKDSIWVDRFSISQKNKLQALDICYDIRNLFNECA